MKSIWARKAINPQVEINQKNEFKCSDIAFIHKHTLHDTLHQVYMFSSEIGIHSGKRVMSLTKASERPSGRR